ncbi:ArsR/SmtB family transcription factor [Halolamina salifodinae]|uniref:Putative transcriptional regulator n=1 Tax=Halolamina salifodinae TaxID=1202767 RepID=A0A8T4GWP0_9EURY|nr:winged helix-turn-helix domain-containing protein [Halolamina salifodinae]MBP1986483.1 putative transcriptional regulator [Halolamina salifodinae]
MSLFDVLGSKARLKILRELVSEPRYVSELAENVGMDGKTAVHHLSTLEEEGIVESYRIGQRKYYRLCKRIELRASPEPDSLFLLHADEIENVDDAHDADNPERTDAAEDADSV